MTLRLGIAGVAAVAALAAFGCRSQDPGQPATEAPATDPSTEAAPEIGELEQVDVTVYVPAADAGSLVGETRRIFKTAQAGDQAKQILSELLPSLPPQTRLRQVYVLEDGTAWADFTGELRTGLGGGSASELMAVYAIVDSLALNLPVIERVGILVDGQPVDTLNGHLDLSGPLPPRRDLISGSAPPAP